MIAVALTAGLVSCSQLPRSQPGEQAGEQPGVLTVMPEALSNNAVAALMVRGHPMLYSFSGLGAGKTRADITSSAYAYDIDADTWTRLPDIPGNRHRLASVAVGLNDRVFLFGGYTVAEGGTEVSTPEVYAFNPLTNEYQPRADMPVPVDDAVAFAYAGRYIYLVSGWHDTGNVADVQVLDTREDRWFAATPYPGAPVFGHAGGVVGNRIVIADGVKVTGVVDGRRQFGISDETWMGIIDPGNPAIIRWQALAAHPGKPLYRMAATGSARLGSVVFVGGSENPYNFNGMGYNGQPSEPSGRALVFDLGRAGWSATDFPTPTMDHRGLPEIDGVFYVIGGMRTGQEVSGNVHSLEFQETD
ncbi:MAG: galactose oxidase [Proteobacteria bacterium]|nr:galactose oxidase [Pseudomonadota bacterium]